MEKEAEERSSRMLAKRKTHPWETSPSVEMPDSLIPERRFMLRPTRISIPETTRYPLAKVLEAPFETPAMDPPPIATSCRIQETLPATEASLRYIRSTTPIPNNSKPLRNVLPTSEVNCNRDKASSRVEALSTEH